MAKATAVDRFMIHAECSENEMGSVISALTKLGIAGVGFELVTDVRTYKKNGPKKAAAPKPKPKQRKKRANIFKGEPGGPIGKEIVLAYLKKHRAVSPKDLQLVFTKAGRNPASVSPILNDLKNAGLVGNPEVGKWAYTPSKKKPVKKAAKKEVAGES